MENKVSCKIKILIYKHFKSGMKNRKKNKKYFENFPNLVKSMKFTCSGSLALKQYKYKVITFIQNSNQRKEEQNLSLRKKHALFKEGV